MAVAHIFSSGVEGKSTIISYKLVSYNEMIYTRGARIIIIPLFKIRHDNKDN